MRVRTADSAVMECGFRICANQAIRAAEAGGFDTSKWFRASLDAFDGEWWFRSDSGPGFRFKDPCVKTPKDDGPRL